MELALVKVSSLIFTSYTKYRKFEQDLDNPNQYNGVSSGHKVVMKSKL
jgi:hypothetical protein